MSSNYPPGVSGNEIEICGPDEYFSEFTCEKCGEYQEEQLFFLFRETIETRCESCGETNISELELYTE
jgi:predicted RNA-binding Zn-ribbon protein involved in translation (DUF1610 family)